jgi:hypothetical protein
MGAKTQVARILRKHLCLCREAKKWLDKEASLCYNVIVSGNGHRSDGAHERTAAVNQKVSIRGVAVAAGVSHQMISRVINRTSGVAKKTRRRAWQVIEELNYQPSATSRSLIHQRNSALGVVSVGLKYAGLSRTPDGVIRQAEEMGYTLLLEELPDFHADDIQPLLNSRCARQVDRIIRAAPEYVLEEGHRHITASKLIVRKSPNEPKAQSESVFFRRVERDTMGAIREE